MDSKTQRWVLAAIGAALMATLVGVELRELGERHRRLGIEAPAAIVPERSAPCVECHEEHAPGVVEPWRRSVHGQQGVGCTECHADTREQADGYDHYGERLVTIVTPRTCGACHPGEEEQFARSAHARAAGSLETPVASVQAAHAGAADSRPCESCHGSTLRLVGTGGERIEAAHLRPDEQGKPTARHVVARVARDADGLPEWDPESWPNSGAGRRNLDGSLGSCASCHGRHDFSVRRARNPETCMSCHRGAEQPEGEVYEASRHGALWRLWSGGESIGRASWVLGKDHAVAPSCATCHMSAYARAGGEATHDPRARLGWKHSAQGSRRANTDAAGRLVVLDEANGGLPAGAEPWQDKRERMKQVCLQCHATRTVRMELDRLDSFTIAVDRDFADPAAELLRRMLAQGARSAVELDDEIEWLVLALGEEALMTAKLGAAMGSPEHAGARGRLAARRLVCGAIRREVRRALESRAADPPAERDDGPVASALAALLHSVGCGP